MKTILLVDDDRMILDVYRAVLSTLGYHVVVASSGREAMELAHSSKPDLVLTDIDMPGSDGCTLLQSLRGDPVLASRPIVLMTGNRTEALRRRSMNLGADDFLAKPISIADLEHCITARLKRSDLSRRVEDRMLEQLGTTLHSTLPHEFFTPLAGVIGLTEILEGDLDRMSHAETREMLRDIRNSGLRLHRTLRNFLLVLDLRGKGAPAAPLSFLSDRTVKEAVKRGAETAAARHGRIPDLGLQLAGGSVAAAESDLLIIVEELVDNACAYSRSGTPVTVEFSADGTLVVRDQGRGMSVTQVAEMGAFRQFDRNKHEQQGLGIGLELVQRLARRHAAEVSVETRPGEGAAVSIRFPIPHRVADAGASTSLPSFIR